MRPIYALLLVIFSAHLLAHAETLQQLLEKQGVPRDSFSPEELSSEVDGATASDEKRVVIAYGQVDRLTGSVLLGSPWVLRFAKAEGVVQRKQLPPDETKQCGGAPEQVTFVDDFILVQTPINPSAECTLVLDEQLTLQKTLYGFAPVQVAPGHIVLIEDMIHFAPVHPERLQLVDLKLWTNSELYPPRGDVLRKKLAAEQAAKMPPQALCTANDEACDPDMFNETIRAFTSDGHGRFAFVATQEASHVMKEGEAPETVASQDVLYVYQKRGSGWRYCQVALQGSEVESTSQKLRSEFESTIQRCTPNRIVFPDLKTQKYNPFVH